MPFMRLQNITPLPQLQGYIDKLWVFESEGIPPNADLNLIVPNGLIKLVIPFRNKLTGIMEGCNHTSAENSITLIGMTDIPSVVVSPDDSYAGTIGVEFSAFGAYRFFHLPQNEIKNHIHSLTTVVGQAAKTLEEHISNAPTLAEKIYLLQQFLLRQFTRQPHDAIYDYCVKKILFSNGRITVKGLEKETGYSSRWLNMKFTEKAGISPKNLASIIRFQQFYQALARNDEKSFFTSSFYDFYYDQSHFIKDFKRFTGMPPTKLALADNEFGKIFYKE